MEINNENNKITIQKLESGFLVEYCEKKYAVASLEALYKKIRDFYGINTPFHDRYLKDRDVIAENTNPIKICATNLPSSVYIKKTQDRKFVKTVSKMSELDDIKKE